jgi:hypothetical protein
MLKKKNQFHRLLQTVPCLSAGGLVRPRACLATDNTVCSKR